MPYRDNRTREIFHFLCEFEAVYKFPPTIQEIADHKGFKSNSAVLRHLDKLEKWGWIDRYHGKARSIRLLRSCNDSNEDSPPPLPKSSPPQ